MIFNEGDIVKVPWSDKEFPVEAPDMTPDNIRVNGIYFTKDGKLDDRHDKPILTLVRRATVKKGFILLYEKSNPSFMPILTRKGSTVAQSERYDTQEIELEFERGA